MAEDVTYNMCHQTTVKKKHTAMKKREGVNETRLFQPLENDIPSNGCLSTMIYTDDGGGDGEGVCGAGTTVSFHTSYTLLF